jgi:hypothetical protein
MIKVRFNLGRGDNYRKWKIEFPDDRDPVFLDPYKVQLILEKAKLHNRKTSAEKIYKGANKFVCAWVECEDVLVTPNRDVDSEKEVSYNPKENPFWVYKGVDADNMKFPNLVTKGNRVFVLNK